MNRRKRSRQEAARRKGGARKNRPTPAWPPAEHRAAGGRVVPLTAARRRAASRRRLAREGGGRVARRRLVGAGAAGGREGATEKPPGSAPASEQQTIDFHLTTCVAGAKAGGRVLMDYWGKRRTYAVLEKGRNDYVTAVDREAEEAIVRLVRDRFPDHSISAEESPPSEGKVGYRWYIDPLDGTTNFIHGYPLFAVSVGLADAQGMCAGAIFDPVRDEMFTAARGMGAFLNGAPIHVSATEKIENGLLVTGIPFRSIDRIEEYLTSFRAFMQTSSGIRRDGSAALDLAYVACGRYDGFWEMALSSWDVAAGSLLVNEAGGVVTDFQGRGAYLESGDIIAATPLVHPSMERVVRESFRKN